MNRTITKLILEWYLSCRRDLPWRRESDVYRVWVSEVMLQQTQVATVVPYYNSFLELFPDVMTLASAKQDDVLKAWEGLGYYSRARNLHAAAQIVVDEHDARIPDDPDTFGSLPGVGDYIRAAVQSIAFGRPLAAVDGNVKRVLARLLALEEEVNDPAHRRVFQKHADALLDETAPGDFNQAMMELGAMVCRPARPLCATCPVEAHCLAVAQDRTHELPRRRKRAKVPEYRVAVGAVEKDGLYLITQRKPSGLLGGLWEFPGGKIDDHETPAEACAREIREEAGIDVSVGRQVAHVRHAYTHFKVEIDVFHCRCDVGDVVLDGPVDYRWIELDEIDNYAFPAANHKFIPALRDATRSSD